MWDLFFFVRVCGSAVGWGLHPLPAHHPGRLLACGRTRPAPVVRHARSAADDGGAAASHSGLHRPPAAARGGAAARRRSRQRPRRRLPRLLGRGAHQAGRPPPLAPVPALVMACARPPRPRGAAIRRPTAGIGAPSPPPGRAWRAPRSHRQGPVPLFRVDRRQVPHPDRPRLGGAAVRRARRASSGGGGVGRGGGGVAPHRRRRGAAEPEGLLPWGVLFFSEPGRGRGGSARGGAGRGERKGRGANAPFFGCSCLLAGGGCRPSTGGGWPGRRRRRPPRDCVAPACGRGARCRAFHVVLPRRSGEAVP